VNYTLLLIPGAILVIVAVICAALAWRSEGRLAIIKAAQRSSAQDVLARYRHEGGAFGQLCEVAGVVESDASLSGPLSGEPCVIYSSTLNSEEWERPSALFRRHVDSTGMVYRGGSTHVDDRHVPTFWVRDATGRVLVDPLMAEFDLKPIDEKYEVMTAGSGQSERRSWHTEKALPLGHEVYVLGYMDERNGEPALGRHPRDGRKRAFISYRSEQELTRETGLRTNLLYVAAGLTGVAGALMIAWAVLRR
jgi:hypothetical protein